MYVRVAPRRLDARWRLHWSMGVERLHTCILQGTTTTWGPTHHPGTWETSTPQSAGTPSIPPPGSLAAPVRQWDPTDPPDRPCQCRSMATPLHQTAAAPWMDGAPLLLACSTKGGLGTLGDPLCPAGLGGRCSKIRQVGTARRALLGLRNHRRVR